MLPPALMSFWPGSGHCFSWQPMLFQEVEAQTWTDTYTQRQRMVTQKCVFSQRPEQEGKIAIKDFQVRRNLKPVTLRLLEKIPLACLGWIQSHPRGGLKSFIFLLFYGFIHFPEFLWGEYISLKSEKNANGKRWIQRHGPVRSQLVGPFT